MKEQEKKNFHKFFDVFFRFSYDSPISLLFNKLCVGVCVCVQTYMYVSEDCIRIQSAEALVFYLFISRYGTCLVRVHIHMDGGTFNYITTEWCHFYPKTTFL